jgi:hypothetical protein
VELDLVRTVNECAEVAERAFAHRIVEQRDRALGRRLRDEGISAEPVRVREALELCGREPLVAGEESRGARRVLEAGMRAVPAEDVEESALQRV